MSRSGCTEDSETATNRHQNRRRTAARTEEMRKNVGNSITLLMQQFSNNNYFPNTDSVDPCTGFVLGTQGVSL